jgi:LPXTG-motif cell wall-anchored protein
MEKRLLSILLVLVMALSVLPTAAFAEDGGENLPACICETACTAEEMNEGCAVCGAEGAQPENCALYAEAPDVDDPAPEDEDDEAFEEDGTPEDGEASGLAPQLAEDGIAVQAAHTHCFCGGSVNAGDHTSHQDVTYTACTRANSLRQIFNIEKVNVAYAYLENDITLDDDLRILGDSDQRGKTLYLCLNGHTLNLGQYFIWVGYMDCTLYLCDCSAQKTGTVSGGSKGCVSVDDAGNYNATFNMYGGTLRGGNRTGFGGGVEIVNGTMNMYGGTITENTATSDGGGIYVGTKGALNLYGGTITKNTVRTNEAHHGGGVYVESNKWSGVGKISISGSPVITGNTRTYTPDSATTTENLYLGYGFTNSGDLPIITLGTVASGANIGISAKKTAFSTASDTDYSGYFSSDDTGYHVEYNADKKLELKSGAAHVHTGGTAYCNKKAVCTTCDKEYGNLDPTNHSAPKPNEWQGDDKEHWQVYSCCNAIINKAAHVGGKATCKDRAVCATCGAAYGGLGAHSFTEKVAEQYLKSAATCTAKAVYYKSCTFCGEKGTETFETGNVLDHDWDEPSYTWTAVTDGYMCVASGKCKNCDADVSDIATVTYAVKKAPTCLNAGTGTYTATFSAAYGFPAQTKDVLLHAIGHTWGTATYTWTQTETGYTCTAKRVCKNDSAHVENETVTGDYSVITEPTCLAAGLGRYQVSFKADWAKDASKDVSIPALGHDWGKWTSNGDGTHTHVCKRDKAHTETVSCSGGTATCVEQATCKDCGGKYGEKDAANHTGAKKWTTTKTTHEQKWSCCGEITVAKEAHTFGKWVVTEKATSRKDGEKTRTCEVCDYVETAKIPATGTSPKTGDDSHIGMWAGILCVSLAGIVALVVWYKRKNRK